MSRHREVLSWATAATDVWLRCTERGGHARVPHAGKQLEARLRRGNGQTGMQELSIQVSAALGKHTPAPRPHNSGKQRFFLSAWLPEGCRCLSGPPGRTRMVEINS